MADAHEDTVFARISLLADTVFDVLVILSAAGAGQGWPSVPVAKTRTGRSRLERRQGWQGAVMASRDRRRPP
ncbi:MAG TPA: hypothetical protein VN456_09860 [Desulfosporosinus sp.]|nr:hypothetical protein [Desulfosporosinus sp.]